MTTHNSQDERDAARKALDSIQSEVAHAANEASTQFADILRRGNARSVSIQDSDGRTLLKIPLTAAVVGAAAIALIAPPRWTVLAVGAALIARVRVNIESLDGEQLKLDLDADQQPDLARARLTSDAKA